MLTQAAVTTIRPVKDLARARRFYEDALGLSPEGLQADGKLLFRCGGSAVLALFPKPEGTKAEHTAVSFDVKDIAAEIRAREARGVQFHEYDLPGFRTVEHVCVLGPEKAGWFRDTEGSILCLHEDIAPKHQCRWSPGGRVLAITGTIRSGAGGQRRQGACTVLLH